MENKLKNLVDYDISIPEFLKRLQCSETNEHEIATLCCIVIGDPIPQVSWFKEDGTQVIPDSHYEINYDIETGNAELLIKERIPYSPPPEIFIPFDSSRRADSEYREIIWRSNSLQKL
jgi:hypothetical protein